MRNLENNNENNFGLIDRSGKWETREEALFSALPDEFHHSLQLLTTVQQVSAAAAASY
jgi:hypothetical protein